MDLLFEGLLEARALGKIRAAHDPERQAGIAALQEADRRLHRVGVAFRVLQEVRDRWRHPGRLPRAPRAAAQLVGHARDLRRREQSQEQLDRGVGLRNSEAEVGRVQAQEAGQIRRRGVRRIELDHRRCDEQDPHDRQVSADGLARTT